MAADKANDDVAIPAEASRGRYVNKRKVSSASNKKSLGSMKMKHLLGCFRHKEKPRVESPAKNKEEEIKQRVVELPEEIIVIIILKLPFKNMIQFSCVSKKWRSLILHDPHFSKTHYKVASEQRTLGQSVLICSRSKLLSRNSAKKLSNPNFQSLHVQVLAGDHHVPNSLSSPFKKKHRNAATAQLLGSCNGLLCISRGRNWKTKYHKNVHIWNPSTGFFRNIFGTEPPRRHGRILGNFFCGFPQQQLARELPHLSTLPQFDDGLIHFTNTGFGYDTATDDYKYVILAPCTVTGPVKAFLFSLRTKCWKSIDAPWSFFQWYSHEPSGIYFNEALHWIAFEVVERKTIITSVDLGKEEFRQMPLPPDSTNKYSTGLHATEVLVLLGDCLCLWRSKFNDDIQFWVMREYNVHESWDLLYCFRTADLAANVAHTRLLPVFVTESGTFLLKVIDTCSLDRYEFLMRVGCHKEKKPVCSYQHIVEEEIDSVLWCCQAIQYDQTLLSPAV